MVSPFVEWLDAEAMACWLTSLLALSTLALFLLWSFTQLLHFGANQ